MSPPASPAAVAGGYKWQGRLSAEFALAADLNPRNRGGASQTGVLVAICAPVVGGSPADTVWAWRRDRLRGGVHHGEQPQRLVEGQRRPLAVHRSVLGHSLPRQADPQVAASRA